MKQIKERNLNKNNRTPLHIALRNKLDKIGELLISKGADINAKDIIYQIMEKSFLIILKQIKEKHLNTNNETLLYIAIKQGSIKMAELLISKGADINAKDIIYPILIDHF